MSESESYYREEARRCRMMARTAKTRTAAGRWAELADEYEQLAVALRRSGRPPALHRALRQQPQAVQQQQSKLRSNKP